MKTENLTNGDRIRIWLEDSVEPEGGTWCYGYVREAVVRKLIFVEDNRPEDFENEIDTFNGYQIEKL
jgi:hypothetical protein